MRSGYDFSNGIKGKYAGRVPTMKLRLLKDNDVVRFTWRTPKHGVAEFSFCPVWKNGGLHRVYVYPFQQPEKKERWVIRASGNHFEVNSWSHKNLERPWHWIYFWCKEHHCMGFRVYVPAGSDHFQLRKLSGISIYFDRTEENDRRTTLQ